MPKKQTFTFQGHVFLPLVKTLPMLFDDFEELSTRCYFPLDSLYHGALEQWRSCGYIRKIHDIECISKSILGLITIPENLLVSEISGIKVVPMEVIQDDILDFIPNHEHREDWESFLESFVLQNGHLWQNDDNEYFVTKDFYQAYRFNLLGAISRTKNNFLFRSRKINKEQYWLASDFFQFVFDDFLANEPRIPKKVISSLFGKQKVIKQYGKSIWINAERGLKLMINDCCRIVTVMKSISHIPISCVALQLGFPVKSQKCMDLVEEAGDDESLSWMGGEPLLKNNFVFVKKLLNYGN